MGPKAHYQQLLQQGIYADPAQQQAVDLLEDYALGSLLLHQPLAQRFCQQLTGKWSRPADPNL